jgi:2-dehydro-3-deoxyphosphogluconate aldolase / (4S)-4-hydroxy-2-oxoglutarate aldolase
MKKSDLIERVKQLGLMPVVRAPSAAAAGELAQALFDGGVKCLEITLTVPGAPSLIRTLVERWGGDACVGAGTVTNDAEARECLDAGSQFLVSPVTVPSLVLLGHAREVPVMLGALTPTEVHAAALAGSDFVKVFPCSALGGASYLEALRGPFPKIALLPTGGVTLETLATYYKAGARVFGVGTALANHKLLAAEGAGSVTALAKSYVAELERLRAG